MSDYYTNIVAYNQDNTMFEHFGNISKKDLTKEQKDDTSKPISKLVKEIKYTDDPDMRGRKRGKKGRRRGDPNRRWINDHWDYDDPDIYLPPPIMPTTIVIPQPIPQTQEIRLPQQSINIPISEYTIPATVVGIILIIGMIFLYKHN